MTILMEVSGIKMLEDMNRVMKYFAAAFVIVAAASCAKENDLENPGQNNETNEYLPEISLTASFADSDSKATLNEKKPHWEASDRICVFHYDPKNTEVNNFSPYDGAYFEVDSFEKDFAVFKGSPKSVNYDTKGIYAAIFPGEAILRSDNSAQHPSTTYNKYIFAANTLSNQTAVAGDFPKASFDASSEATANLSLALTSTANASLSFKNLNAFFKFTVDASSVRTIVVSADQVTNYNLSAMDASADLGGTVYYYPHSDSEVRMGLGSDTPITFTNGSSDFVVGTTYYIAIPAVKMSGLKVTFKDAAGNVLHTFKKASEFTAQPNNIYNLGSMKWPNVGDYFYKDGTYSTELNTSKTVVGVIFWVGDPTEDDSTLKRDYPNCTHGLVVGYKNDGKYDGAVSGWGYWGTEYAYNCNNGTTFDTKYEAYYKKTGYTNTQKLKTAQPNANAISVCDSYTPVKNASSWYMPTIAEFDELVTHVAAVNNTFASYNTYCYENISATTYPSPINLFILRGSCWTVSEDKSGMRYAACYNFDNWSYRSPSKTNNANLRPIFAF